MLGGPLLCDGWIGASREIGETVWRGGSVWLELAGHELGERESEQREKEREQRLGWGAGGGSVAWDSEEERAGSEEKEREQRLSESERVERGETHILENGLRNFFS